MTSNELVPGYLYRGNRPRTSADLTHWQNQSTPEAAIDPWLPIIDPHHHIFDSQADAQHYRLEELTRDLTSGHKVLATVCVEAYGHAWLADGSPELRSVGEVQALIDLCRTPVQGSGVALTPRRLHSRHYRKLSQSTPIVGSMKQVAKKTAPPPSQHSKASRSETGRAKVADSAAVAESASNAPNNHRTIDRVTQILEEVVYHPGMTFAELVRALGAAKSSVHGFIQGLLAKGWLYEDQRRFFLGPAVYGLTMASGHIRAGLVTHDDLAELYREARVPVFLGVQAGDHLIYISEAGSDDAIGYEARSNIRRTLLSTAGGKALLALRPQAERDAYLRRRSREEPELVDRFINELPAISKTGFATNINATSTRFGIGTTIRNRQGEAVASITLVGPASVLQPKTAKLSKILLKYADTWSQRSLSAREAI